jgi:hypothetical protein
MDNSTDDLWKKVKELNGTAVPKNGGANGASQAVAFPEPEHSDVEPIDVRKLKSALASLDPDCDERTWMAYRIGPLVNAAKQFPDLHDELYALGWHFSSGKLRGVPAATWTKKTKHGKPRRNRLSSLWRHFMKSNYTGEPVKVVSIYFHARQEGWTGEDDFEEVAE